MAIADYLYKDTYRHASIDIDSDKTLALAVAHKTQAFTLTGGKSIAGATYVKLIISFTIDSYKFSYRLEEGGSWQGEQVLGSVSAADFSGDDFTGKSNSTGRR